MFTVMVVSALILTSAPTRPVIQMPHAQTMLAVSSVPVMKVVCPIGKLKNHGK